ncbi:exocyst subunit SEC10 ASCRUDRAFT_60164 [Ascoidea rubescens DSM 1968]|uniref:Uncharacterized protein n=1 Tax=Ascoidea rubescens DSM 1968 TaxID=1344418 RepID=A0A1D2VDG7_9ASCO|nr:hypothetical protein ASCRUDRAFT_60164 [Ascoidea rubescens DSM 1968]ODV59533.1 hypothetical protein ASCRUDRAFT_60164 [Ascoidea rubescens DSM 1968]
MNIYQLDPHIKTLLSLDNFLGDLSVHEFIEEITKDNDATDTLKDRTAPINNTNNNQVIFDPKPFIRTFESTLKELKQVNNTVSHQKLLLEDDVSNFELNHSYNIITLNTQVQSLNLKFNSLDEKILNVSKLINPLGEKLTKITNLQKRNVETIFILKCYDEFYKLGFSNDLNKLLSSHIHQDHEILANYLSKLSNLSEKIQTQDIPKTIFTHEIIQSFAKNFESNLLNDFNQAYLQNNSTKMKQSVDLLTGFNVHSDIVSIFIDNHQFFKFLSENPFQIDENNQFWSNLSDCNLQQVFYNSDFKSFLNNIKLRLIDLELINILMTYKNTPKIIFLKVFELFIKYLYNKIIIPSISMLLDYSKTLSNLSFVRLLHSSFLLLNDFTKNLKKFFQSSQLNIDQTSKKFDDLDLPIEFNEKNSQPINKILTNNTFLQIYEDLSNLLDQLAQDCFSEYINNKNDKYFDLEKKSLEDIILNTTLPFEIKNEKAIKEKNLMSRINNADSIKSLNDSNSISINNFSNTNILPKSKGSLRIENNKLVQLRQFMNFYHNNLTKSEKNAIPSNYAANVDDCFSDISFEAVDRVLKSSVESISRILELKPNKIPDYLLEVVQILIYGIGTNYLDFGFEVSYHKLIHLDYKNSSVKTIDLYYLFIINRAIELLNCLTNFISMFIVPLVNNSFDIKKRIINLVNGYLTSCEISLNLIVKGTVDIINHKILLMLNKQKKKDFLIKQGKFNNLLPSSFQSTTNSIYGSMNNNDKNLENFLTEVGLSLLSLLLLHFKKFQVNSVGGLVLTKDIIRYQSVIDSWSIESLSDKFSILRDIANLFTVQSEYIHSLIKESQKLMNINISLLLQFISKRSDYDNNMLNKIIQ